VSTRLEDALEACLRSLGRGASVESAVSAFPEMADELRSLLQAAQAASSLASSGVSRHALVRSRTRLMQRAAAIAPARRRSLWPALARPALAGLVAAAALFLGGAGLAAAQSLPGDSLYPAKLVAQDVILRLAASPKARLSLEEQYADQRIEEVQRLLALGRVAPVTFTGLVQEASDDVLQVAEIPVRLSLETIVVGDVFKGTSAEVRGLTQIDGTVLAEEVHLRAFDVYGVVDQIRPEAWVVAGTTLALTPDSIIEPGLAAGDFVHVRVSVDETGSLSIEEAESVDQPTATPAPSSTSPPATPSPTLPPPASAVPERTPTVEPSDDHGESEPIHTPEASEEEGEGDDGDSDGEELDFTGPVQAIGASQWTIGGVVMRVDGDTEIRDDPQVGDTVRVKARRQIDGSWLAEKIEREDD
jgi:hypothetical protein